MGKNRDKLSIIADVLTSVSTGCGKTRIMFSANLSFKLLEKYLEITLDAGLIRLDNSVYSLTEDGREFLVRYKDFHQRYSKLQGLLEDLGSEQEKLNKLLEKQTLVRSAKLSRRL